MSSLTTERPADEVRDPRRRWERIRDWFWVRPYPAQPVPNVPLQYPRVARTGICCSGGGVRSAVYNLGALQVLREQGVWGHTDYVSAVSGGSYIAAAHAALDKRSPPHADEKPLWGPGSPEEQHLRTHSSYLAPGVGGKARLLLVVVLGMLVNLVVIGIGVWLLARPLGWLAGAAYPQLHADQGSGGLDLRVWMWLVPVVALGLGVLAALPNLLFPYRGRQPFVETGTFRWGCAALALAVLLIVLEQFTSVDLLPLGWIGPLIFGSFSILSGLLELLVRVGSRPATEPSAATKARRAAGIRFDRQRFTDAWSARLVALGIVLAVLLIAVPQVILWARAIGHVSPASIADSARIASQSGNTTAAANGTGLLQVINLGAIVMAGLGALRAFVARRRSFFVLAAAAIAGPLAVITPALWILNKGAVTGITEAEVIGFLVVFGVAVLMWLLGDLTQWSLHPYYRRRLSSAFFIERSDSVPGPIAGERGVTEIPYNPPLRWSTLTYPDFPKLIVCASANVSDEGVTPPGRWATPFTFTQEEIGGPLIGALPTGDYEAAASSAERSVTLRASVAMSGAAVSPVMGKKTIRAVSFLLALTNVRLGVWVPNPRRVHQLDEPRFAAASRVLQHGGGEDASTRRRFPQWLSQIGEKISRRRPSPIYLVKELLGKTRVNDRFLYVTDGGHYDNLGLIELLRRGCTTIFCLDAGGDPGGNYSALGEAIALARSDLQVDIEIDPTSIEPNKKGISKDDFVIGRFRFRAVEEADGSDTSTDWIGQLIYCRAAVTEDAPWDVKAFHDRDKRFPYHSTLDQLFNDEKFESYRALGAHTAQRAVQGWRREIAASETHRILRETASRGETLTHDQLLQEVKAALGDVVLPSLQSLLEEIAEFERSAKRPPLELVVRDGEAAEPDIEAKLESLRRYWEEAMRGDGGELWWAIPRSPVEDKPDVRNGERGRRWLVRMLGR